MQGDSSRQRPRRKVGKTLSPLGEQTATGVHHDFAASQACMVELWDNESVVQPANRHPALHRPYAAIPWQQCVHFLWLHDAQLPENMLRDPLVVHVKKGNGR